MSIIIGHLFTLSFCFTFTDLSNPLLRSLVSLLLSFVDNATTGTNNFVSLRVEIKLLGLES